MMRILLGLLAFSSSLLMAQDYYSPTTKDKEPLARFPIEVVVENGVMSYTLPKELVGVDTPITLNEVNEVDGIRTFTGPKATAVCMGAEKTPGCVVTHRNLVADKKQSLALAEQAINQRFTDPTLRTQALTISGEFLDHSGNEPIGFIGALKPRAVKWVIPGTPVGSAVTPRTWTSHWIYDKGGRTNAEITFDEIVAGQTQSKGTTTMGGQKHTDALSLRWSAFHATGTWKISDKAQGWFDITFDADLKKFEGYFGHFVNGTAERQGRWYGEVKP